MNKLVQRTVCIVICVLVCVSFCSCQLIDTILESQNVIGMPEDTSLGYVKMVDCDFEYSGYYDNLRNKSSYQMLENDNMRALYDMLYENVYYVYPQANEDGEYKTKQVVLEGVQLTEAQIRLTIKALTDDNPQLFFISTTFGFLISSENNYTCAQLYSLMSPSQLQNAIYALKGTVDAFYSTLKQGLSEYQLELLIHDYILATCRYDSDVELDSDGQAVSKTNAFSSYGALVEKKAVCEGYSRAFQLLCNGVGIDTINVIGNSQGELHMWNAVKLDGDYYYVDVTWDDNDDKLFCYDYFNISEEQLRKDHEFSRIYSEMTDAQICGNGSMNALTSNFFIPVCENSAYNYFVREAPHLENYHADNIEERLLTAAENRDEYFHIYIDPDDFEYDDAVDLLFHSYPQYFFTYVDNVNYRLSDYSIDGNLSIYRKKELNVVTVELEYL